MKSGRKWWIQVILYLLFFRRWADLHRKGLKRKDYGCFQDYGIAMRRVNMSDNTTCKNCFFGEISHGKPVPKEGEKPDWYWRFDFKTRHDGYCKDEYFENMHDNKYGKCSPEIAGYVIRKNDFDKEEKIKLKINIITAFIGGIMGFALNHFLN